MLNSSKEKARNTGRTQRSRKRASVACQSCHVRKVRCSLPQTGRPCANCSLDDVSGVPRVSKRANAVSSPSNGNAAVQSTPLEGSSFPPGPERLGASEDLSVRSGQTPTALSIDETGDGTETPYHPFNEHFSHHNGGGTGTSQPVGDTADKCYSPLYGDPRGVGLVVDICEPEPRNKSGHFLVPRIGPTHMDQETMDYLCRKGVFDLPTPSVCEMIIRTYFHYVHPFFPVVDARSFLNMFENVRNEVSVHLLWSMFLAAANFADDSILKAANFSCRKEMKRAMYIRAKALYDAEYERRKITLIQAVLLTGFWYSDTEDRTGPWHWNGVAIGLCQTIGLHRQPNTGRKHSKAISMSDSRIWRQIWWSCFYREAWFSAGMGRPMRINLADCSTPMPDTKDLDNLLAGIPESIQRKYLPESTEVLSKLWTELLALTVSLAKILSWQNRAERMRPSRSEIQHMDDNVRQYYSRKGHAIAHTHSHVVSLHAYHLELYLESVILILYRQFLFDKPETNSPVESADEWTSTVVRRTRDAATNTNKILGDMIGADMISSAQAMVCIALVPALQIHLLDTTSEKQLVRRMGCHNLEFCMMIIEELKTVYFGAEILSRMFTKAKSRLYNQTVAPATTPREYIPTSSRDPTIGSIPDAADDARQDDAEIFDAFSTILSPFASVTACGLFDDDELLAFESDITLGQLMFPEPESSAGTR
ncbi:Zn(II)2Cys6 transcription factor [Aspergillus fischeri NRRL 181]|uniref:Fungal specific transcription factor, putative n=1 Tax=Neosartorya fischeri (strain ATCC 1020 / DSM 3700 / CBS 544.65 / FGSC A1164 / JCM 1740 / NRRL 181 / WB 181) TaxID=331117 RepID=A1DK44_NEOFI|nr:fungal specific transcription factor, putative [Aspergillus fischeri NRRL 181]EAW17083.1 fungal specific transcription factor, putative [Aspergillus fischeri NRRL 181]